MPAAVHLQLRIIGDDGTVFTDNKILRLEKSGSKPLASRSARAKPCRNAFNSSSSQPRRLPMLIGTAAVRPPAVRHGNVPDRLSHCVRHCRPLQPALSPLWLPTSGQQDLQLAD